MRTRNVLECSGPAPLLERARVSQGTESARGLAQSKTWEGVVAFCFLIGGLGLRCWGQYAIDWHTIDGGGDTSTGGVYSVSGTIGQPDAGAMSGGSYTLHGGFWGIIAAIQTEGAPHLTVTRSNNAVIVSWPLPAEGWVLEATNVLPQVSASWPQIAPPYQTNGANLQFTEWLPAGNKFYRLHKP